MSEQHPYRATIAPIPEETSRPLWSVMIPTYNCAKYLRETLASVLAQDPGPEVMQIEVVDDCSNKDDPQAVVAELGKGRVSFYQQPENVGHTKNFETCLERSRGKIIHLLHGDDCVRDGFYRKMQQAFDTRPDIGAAFSRHIFMDERGHWESISPLEQSESGVLINWLETIATFQRIQTPSIVVRREVYETLGGFDRRLSWTEDWEMWVRIAAYYPVWYEVEPLAVYRKHSASSTGRNMLTGENLRDVRRAIKIFQSYLPDLSTNKLTRKARENWAIYTLNSVVPQYLTERKIAAARAQIWEALKCSYSFKAIELIFRLFIWAGTRWFIGKLRRTSELFRHSFSEIVNSYIRLPILRNSVRHIYGLTKIDYAKDELIVLCVVRNGEAYIKSFIEHYFALGVKHIVFLFNDSTDSSILLACQYKDVTVLETACPYKKYETAMKKYLVNRFSKNRWNIFSDIDELFDYPFSDVMSLKSLLAYLNTKNYTAVVAQMLDLFSDKSLASFKSEKDNSIKDIYVYYDISNLEKEKYRYGTLSNQDVKLYYGGIRKTLFGTRNGLTKAALIFADRKIQTFVDYHHVSSNARIADFTGVILHYPFSSNFYEKVMEAAKSRRYEQSADREYQMYWDRLKREPNMSMKQETACKLESVNCLLQNGFLVGSEDYLQWVKTQANLSSLSVATSEVSPKNTMS